MPIDCLCVEWVNGQMDASLHVPLIALASLIVTTAGTLFLAWMGYKIKRLEHHVNSMRDEQLTTTAAKSHAEGELAGRAAVKKEQKETPPP